MVKFILLSYGRSGTGFIMSTIKSIFDSKSKNHYEKELFGSNETVMEFNRKNVIKMVDDYFDKRIKKYPDSYIYGFKWKPYYLDEKLYTLDYFAILFIIVTGASDKFTFEKFWKKITLK